MAFSNMPRALSVIFSLVERIFSGLSTPCPILPVWKGRQLLLQ